MTTGSSGTRAGLAFPHRRFGQRPPEISERLRLDKIVAGLGQRGGSDSAEEAKMQKSEKQLQVKLKKGTIFYPNANTQAEGFFSSLHLSAHILGVLLPSGQMISISTSTSGPGRAGPRSGRSPNSDHNHKKKKKSTLQAGGPQSSPQTIKI